MRCGQLQRYFLTLRLRPEDELFSGLTKGSIMHVYTLNPNLLTFYLGGDAEPDAPPVSSQTENTWAYNCCESLGRAVYVIHNNDMAVVYDTMCSPEQAGEIKSFLETELGIAKFTVATSHWHLGHVGGNELYKASNIVACRKTRETLLRHKDAIEAGTLWGKPAINPLRLPDIVFDQTLSIFLDDLEVALYNFNIHSEDSVCLYLPRYKILLAGDMLEDTIPFIAAPQDIPVHLNNYEQLRALDIDRILPSHGRSATIRNGGYAKEFIDSITYYLSELYARLEKDPDSPVPELDTFMSAYLDKGLIGLWPPYKEAHLNNVAKLREFFKSPPGVEIKLY